MSSPPWSNLAGESAELKLLCSVSFQTSEIEKHAGDNFCVFIIVDSFKSIMPEDLPKAGGQIMGNKRQKKICNVALLCVRSIFNYVTLFFGVVQWNLSSFLKAKFHIHISLVIIGKLPSPCVSQLLLHLPIVLFLASLEVHDAHIRSTSSLKHRFLIFSPPLPSSYLINATAMKIFTTFVPNWCSYRTRLTLWIASGNNTSFIFNFLIIKQTTLSLLCHKQ